MSFGSLLDGKEWAHVLQPCGVNASEQIIREEMNTVSFYN